MDQSVVRHDLKHMMPCAALCNCVTFPEVVVLCWLFLICVCCDFCSNVHTVLILFSSRKFVWLINPLRERAIEIS